MKALRPLLLVLVFVLLMVFMFQNAWLHEMQSIRYDLPFLLPLVADVPNWALVLTAFLIGYVLAWTVGRLDLFAQKNAARKSRKRTTELESELAEEREKNLRLVEDHAKTLQAERTSRALAMASQDGPERDQPPPAQDEPTPEKGSTT